MKYEVSRISEKETKVLGTTGSLEFLDQPESGKYRYLVRAVYAGDKLSDGKTSNEVLFDTDGVDSIGSDSDDTFTVYNLQGILIIDSGTRADLMKLPEGVYIINGKTQLLK